MFKAKEVMFIVLAAAVMGYVISFPVSSYHDWIKFAFVGLGILLVNIIAKKILAYKLGCELEIMPWNFERYGFDRAQYFARAIPAWLIVPILLVWLSVGSIWWLVVSTFEVQATLRRVGRKFAEITEWDIALIAAFGIIANLVVAVAASSLGYEKIAFASMWFVFFNMIPFPAYDGGRIFFGGRIFWVFMFALSIAILILLHIATGSLITIAASLLTAAIAAVLVYSLTKR